MSKRKSILNRGRTESRMLLNNPNLGRTGKFKRPSAGRSRSDRRYKKARKAFEAGLYEEAVDLFNRSGRRCFLTRCFKGLCFLHLSRSQDGSSKMHTSAGLDLLEKAVQEFSDAEITLPDESLDMLRLFKDACVQLTGGEYGERMTRLYSAVSAKAQCDD